METIQTGKNRNHLKGKLANIKIIYQAMNLYLQRTNIVYSSKNRESFAGPFKLLHGLYFGNHVT